MDINPFEILGEALSNWPGRGKRTRQPRGFWASLFFTILKLLLLAFLLIYITGVILGI